MASKGLSRHCLAELTQQAAQLEEKGITVVTVRVAGSEGSSADQQAGEDCGPLLAGYLTGDIEKARLAWGAAALPHLILTDRRHIVVAEGFGLAEVDAKIQVASGRGNP
jgi:hypothetical protein